MILLVLLAALSREIIALSPSNPDIMKNLLGEWDVETEGRQYQFVFKFYMEDHCCPNVGIKISCNFNNIIKI